MQFSGRSGSASTTVRRLVLALLLVVGVMVLVAPAASATPLFSGAALGHANYVNNRYTGVSMLPDGSAIVVGSYAPDNSQSGSFDLIGGAPLPTVTNGTRNGFVAKRAADGTYTWQLAAVASFGDVVTVFDVAGLPDGSAIIVGQYRGTATFGDISLGPAAQPTLFAAKVKADGTGFAWRCPVAARVSRSSSAWVCWRTDPRS